MLSRPYLQVVFYIGLKDRERKKIFEGDILEVEVDHGEGFVSRFNEVVDYNDEMTCFSPSGFDFGTKFKIIGNIFENKELLEGE